MISLATAVEEEDDLGSMRSGNGVMTPTSGVHVAETEDTGKAKDVGVMTLTSRIQLEDAEDNEVMTPLS